MAVSAITPSSAIPARHRVVARRRVAQSVVVGLLLLATILAVALLVTILGYVIVRGLPALDLAFFTERPRPFGESGGGIGPALLGTALLAAVNSGAISATVAQYPYTIGQLGVEACLAAMRGKSVPANVAARISRAVAQVQPATGR